MSTIQEGKQMAKAMILTIVLVVLGLVIFMIGREFPNSNLWIMITLLLLVDIVFIVAMILGIRTKNSSVIIVSVITNGMFFLLLTLFLFFLTLANGLSEP